MNTRTSALCKIVFAKIPRFDHKIEELQDALRKRFPDLRPVEEEQIRQIDPATGNTKVVEASKIMLARGSDKKDVVIIRSTEMFYATVNYRGFESFQATIELVLNAIKTTLDVSHYGFYGFRKIVRLEKPTTAKDFSGILTDPAMVQPELNNGMQKAGSNHVSAYVAPDGTMLKLQTGVSVNSGAVPDDVKLAFKEIADINESLLGVWAHVDIDCYFGTSTLIDFETKDLIGRISSLRQISDDVFNQLVRHEGGHHGVH